MTTGRTRLPRVAAFLAIVLILAAFPPGAGNEVAAHAALISTAPANGEVLAEAPAELRLTFNERVQPVEGGFRLFDDSQQETVLSARASGNDVVVDLPADMADGSWAMGWRVISADGHPISGLVAFAVGTSTGEIAAPVEAEDTLVERTTGVVQGLAYVTMLTSLGLVLFHLFVREGWSPARSERRLLAVMGLAGIGCWLLVVPLGVVRQRGLALDAVWRWRDWADHFDSVLVTTSLMVAGGLLLSALIAPRLPRSAGIPIAMAGVLIALVGPTVSGHTRMFTPAWAMVTSNLVHTAAAAVWLGGLLGLVLALRGSRGAEKPVVEDAGLVARFSTLAGVTLVLLILSGLLTGWLVLDGIRPFFETTWGRYVLIKLALVLVVALLAAWNRFRLVPVVASHEDDAPAARARLRHIVVAEILLLVVVALVTGFLVNQSPAAGSSTLDTVPPDHQGAIPITIALGDGELRGTVEPGHPGTNTFLITITDAEGAPMESQDPPQIQATLPEADLGPFVVDAVPGDELGTFVAEVPLPLQGDWDITVSVRVSRFEEVRGSITLPIPEVHAGH